MCFLGTKKNGIRDGDKKKVWDAGFSRKKSENKGTPPLPPPHTHFQTLQVGCTQISRRVKLKFIVHLGGVEMLKHCMLGNKVMTGKYYIVLLFHGNCTLRNETIVGTSIYGKTEKMKNSFCVRN